MIIKHEKRRQVVNRVGRRRTDGPCMMATQADIFVLAYIISTLPSLISPADAPLPALRQLSKRLCLRPTNCLTLSDGDAAARSTFHTIGPVGRFGVTTHDIHFPCVESSRCTCVVIPSCSQNSKDVLCRLSDDSKETVYYNVFLNK